MVDVFSEVDEELRHEKLKATAKKFGPWVIGTIVLFIGAMGGQVYWENQIKEQRIAESQRYHQAMTQLEDGNTRAALADFETLISDAEFGYDLLARLQVAATHARDGRMDEALSVYDAIAVDSTVDKRFQNFASLMAVGILLDRGVGPEVYERLLPLTEQQGGWQYSAKEMLGLAHFKEGNWQAAEDVFVALTLDNSAPQDLRNRAQEFMQMIENAKPPEDLFNIEGDNDPLAEAEENVADGDDPDAE